MLNYSSTPFIVWDTSFRILRFNYAFEKLAGHKVLKL
ncbi:MAG: hypothetical protein IPH20_16695 [Bacteroidales bacterium]|nr:hypothetical protein [Bacteroidales bacterium]